MNVDPEPVDLVGHGAGTGRTNWRRRVWIPALDSAGIPPPRPRVHDLRHTAAALSIEAGAHPKAIQAMLGHSSITVTLDRYGHLFPALSEGLAEGLDAIARKAEGAGVAHLWHAGGLRTADGESRE